MSNRDWEAIAIDTHDRLWIADSVATARSNERFVYVVDEPNPTTATTVRSSVKYEYTFPGRTYLLDVEAMFPSATTCIWSPRRPTAAEVLPTPTRSPGRHRPTLTLAPSPPPTSPALPAPTSAGREGVCRRLSSEMGWPMCGGDGESMPNTVSGADDLVRRFIATPPTWQHAFRVSELPLQVEGVAISLPTLGRALTMVAEGSSKHVLYVRSSMYQAVSFGGGITPPPPPPPPPSVRLPDGFRSR
ncbi:MAG: hypothetical protein R2706_20270 [Acidimicrobiales bacterium]